MVRPSSHYLGWIRRVKVIRGGGEDAATEYVMSIGIRVRLLISRYSLLLASAINILSLNTSIHCQYTALPRDVAALQSQIQLGLV